MPKNIRFSYGISKIKAKMSAGLTFLDHAVFSTVIHCCKSRTLWHISILSFVTWSNSDDQWSTSGPGHVTISTSYSDINWAALVGSASSSNLSWWYAWHIQRCCWHHNQLEFILSLTTPRCHLCTEDKVKICQQVKWLWHSSILIF